MGIKELWPILTPFCERKPLYELQGKKVAIDLSCWVCEAQNVTEYNIQPRMYLRNLYFRTCYLILTDVTPVFVLEGRAPEMKYKTIAARNAHQFKGAKPKSSETKAGKDRSRFNHTLKLCSEMLSLMGLACVQGDGEAEACCAYLNADKLVDGIISQDSDCFAYGARTVYRNFSIAAQGGSVDVYDLSRAETALDFGRNKIVALALLCGSDYSQGVHGVGKDSALKLFSSVSEKDILARISAWRSDSRYFEAMEKELSDKTRCSSCGHGGSVQLHTRRGCPTCGTAKSCGDGYKTERAAIKNEIAIRSKAIKDLEFPDQGLIDEFLIRKSGGPKVNLKWSRPDMAKFVRFCCKYLQWEEIYAFEKFLPVLTRWTLLNPGEKAEVRPKMIKKARNPKGVPSFELVWEDASGSLADLVGEDISEKLWSTVEPQHLVGAAFPELVSQFEASKKKTKRKKKEIAELSGLLANISLTDAPKAKKTRKQTTLRDFFGTSTPVKTVNSADFALDQSNFGDENDLDVSAVVERVVASKNGLDLKQYGFDVIDSDCTFFMHSQTENDLFERTLNEMINLSDEMSSEDEFDRLVNCGKK